MKIQDVQQFMKPTAEIVREPGLDIVWLEDDDGDITITHKLIFEAGTNTFWEVYFDNPTNNERALLDNVVKDLSLREGNTGANVGTQ